MTPWPRAGHHIAANATTSASKSGVIATSRSSHDGTHADFHRGRPARTESTLLALNHVFTHWGGIIARPGYTDPIQFGTGNPYGVHHRAGSGMPGDITLQAARHQATRAGEVAAALKAVRATGHIDDGAQA